jgi:hypothetical protein
MMCPLCAFGKDDDPLPGAVRRHMLKPRHNHATWFQSAGRRGVDWSLGPAPAGHAVDPEALAKRLAIRL